jgi:hypothetical protein
VILGWNAKRKRIMDAASTAISWVVSAALSETSAHLTDVPCASRDLIEQRAIAERKINRRDLLTSIDLLNF